MQGEKTHLFNLEKSGAEKTAVAAAVVVTVIIIGGRIALWML